MKRVAIFIGSASDKDKMQPCSDVLGSLGIDHLYTVTSAHRTPERTAKLVAELEEQGCEVFICAAGMAAHLAGVVASKTIRPVIGVPLNASPLQGMDALLATLQMPPGFPVGTVALDKPGAKNAAYMAAQILALHDAELAKKLMDVRQGFKDSVEKAASEM